MQFDLQDIGSVHRCNPNCVALQTQGQTMRLQFASEPIRDLWFFCIAQAKQMQTQSYNDDPFAFKYVPCEEADQEVDVQSAFKSVMTDNLAFTFTSALGTVLKR